MIDWGERWKGGRDTGARLRVRWVGMRFHFPRMRFRRWIYKVGYLAREYLSETLLWGTGVGKERLR